MTYDSPKFAVPNSLLAAGPLLRFDFSFLDRIIDGLSSDSRFIDAIVMASMELKALQEAGEIRGDSEEINEAIRFLEQEATSTTIAFNSKIGIIKL